MTKPKSAAQKAPITAKPAKAIQAAPVVKAPPGPPQAVKLVPMAAEVRSWLGDVWVTTPQPLPSETGPDVLHVDVTPSHLAPIQACSHGGIPWVDDTLYVEAIVGTTRYSWVNPESILGLKENEDIMASIFLPVRRGMEIGQLIDTITITRGALKIATVDCQNRPLARLTLEVRVL